MNLLARCARAVACLCSLCLVSACASPPAARSGPRLSRAATPFGATPARTPSPLRLTALADVDPRWVERTRTANMYDGAVIYVLGRAPDATGPSTRANTRPFLVTLGDRSGSQGPDRDRDGLSDAAELRLGTNPDSVDTDGDTLPDAFELFGTGTRATVADSDGDGMADNVELNIDDPNIYADTDGDGLTDGQERAHLNTDPRSVDSDSDGLGDDLEFYFGTAMNDAAHPDVDTDDDGEPDGYEQANGQDGQAAGSHGADSDNDDVPDWLDRNSVMMARVPGRRGAVAANSPDCGTNTGNVNR